MGPDTGNKMTMGGPDKEISTDKPLKTKRPVESKIYPMMNMKNNSGQDSSSDTIGQGSSPSSSGTISPRATDPFGRPLSPSSSVLRYY